MSLVRMLLAQVSASLRVLVFALFAVAAVVALAPPAAAEALTADFTYDKEVDVAPASTVESPGLLAPLDHSDTVIVPFAETAGRTYDSSANLLAPRTTFSNLDPSDVPRVNGFQAINPNSLSSASGRFNYTILDDGSLVVANRRYGHIDLANGGDELATGEVQIVNGQIRSINNASGHYRPSSSPAQSAAENAFNALDLDVAPGAYREIGG